MERRTFTYSNDGNGDLMEIAFPTGGTISYTWTNAASCSGQNKYPRAVATRTVNAMQAQATIPGHIQAGTTNPGRGQLSQTPLGTTPYTRSQASGNARLMSRLSAITKGRFNVELTENREHYVLHDT